MLDLSAGRGGEGSSLEQKAWGQGSRASHVENLGILGMG